MVLFQFIPKSGIFSGFQLLGTPIAAFQHQSAPFPIKIIEKLPPDAIFELKIYQNAFVAIGELTALHRRPSSWWEGCSLPLPKNPTPPSYFSKTVDRQ